MTACQRRRSAHEPFRLVCQRRSREPDWVLSGIGPTLKRRLTGPRPSARSRLNALRRPDRGGDESYHGPRVDGRRTVTQGWSSPSPSPSMITQGLLGPQLLLQGLVGAGNLLSDDSLGRDCRWRHGLASGPPPGISQWRSWIGASGRGSSRARILHGGRPIPERHRQVHALVIGHLHRRSWTRRFREVASRADDRRPRRRFPGRSTSIMHVHSYYVYANQGLGDRHQLCHTCGRCHRPQLDERSLNVPGQYRFGVRAFDSSTGLEEQNIDAAVLLSLDAAGNDVTRVPFPPVGLRAFPKAGGVVRVEWICPISDPSRSTKWISCLHDIGIHHRLLKADHDRPVVQRQVRRLHDRPGGSDRRIRSTRSVCELSMPLAKSPTPWP